MLPLADGNEVGEAVERQHVLGIGLVETKPYRVDIETQSELTRGRTVVDLHSVSGHGPNADVGLKIYQFVRYNFLHPSFLLYRKKPEVGGR